MHIRLVVTIEGEAARWQREVERPYPGVPHARDWVYLGETDEGLGLMATPIAVVTWENDGAVKLRLDLTGTGAGTVAQLESFGFAKQG
jgi:hypothetical protein